MENSIATPTVTFPQRLMKWQNNEDIFALLNAAVSHPEWIAQETKKRPVNGSLVLYNKSDTANFKQDAYRWKMRKDGRMIREDHMKLKVNGKDVITANYAHSALLATFHRRSYATTARQDIVLVHYLNDLKTQSDHSDKIVSLLRNCRVVTAENTSDVVEELKPIWGCAHDVICPELENELKNLVELALQSQINPKLIGESIENLEVYAKRFSSGTAMPIETGITPMGAVQATVNSYPSFGTGSDPTLFNYALPNGFRSTTPELRGEFDFSSFLADFCDPNQTTSSLSTPPHGNYDATSSMESGFPTAYDSPRRALEMRTAVKCESLSDLGDGGQPVELLLQPNRKRPVDESPSKNGCDANLNDEVFSGCANFVEFSSAPTSVVLAKPRDRRTSRPRLIDSAYSSCSMATDKDGVAAGGDLSFTHSFETSDPSPPDENDLNLRNFTRNGSSVANYIAMAPLDSPEPPVAQPNCNVKDSSWANFGMRSRFSPPPSQMYSEKNLGMTPEEALAFISANCAFDSPKSLATIDSADLGSLDHSNHSSAEGAALKMERLESQADKHLSQQEATQRGQQLIEDISFVHAFTRQISDPDELAGGGGVDDNCGYVHDSGQESIDDCSGTGMADRITDFSPEWSYPEGATKVLITGSWMDLNGSYAVVFDSCQTVPAVLIQQGVLRCFCPPHPPGPVSMEVAHNGHLISEAVTFEYRAAVGQVSVASSIDVAASTAIHLRTPSLPVHNDTPYGRPTVIQVQKQLSLDSQAASQMSLGHVGHGDVGCWRFPAIGGRGGKSPKGIRAKPEDLEELLSQSTSEIQRERLSLHRAETHLAKWLNNPNGNLALDSPESMFVAEDGKESDEEGRRMKLANLAQWIIDALPDSIKQEMPVELMETDSAVDQEETREIDTSAGDFTHFRYADDIRSPLSIRSDCSFLQSPPSVPALDQPDIAMSNPSNTETLTLSELGEFFNASRRPLERNFQELALSDREQRELYEAAKVIQNAYRQYRNRALQQQDIERQAAVVIQSYYRRYKQYCYFKKVHRAVVLIQKHFRRYRSKQRQEGYEGCGAKYLEAIQSAEEIGVDLPSSSTAAVSLPSALNSQMTRDSISGGDDSTRSFLLYTQPSVRISVPQFSPEEFRKWKQEIAAIRIQHAFRGHYMRKRQAAARKIQKFMRETRQKLQMARASTSAEGACLHGSQRHFQGDGFTPSD